MHMHASFVEISPQLVNSAITYVYVFSPCVDRFYLQICIAPFIYLDFDRIASANRSDQLS